MLDTVDSFLSDLESRDLAYCHWKSNEALGAALDGERDLDLLCSRADATAVRETLSDNGFHRFEDTSDTRYPHLENHVGFDPATGRLVHVHLHFELTVGTPYLKEYVTPWADYVLERRRRGQESGVFTSPPDVELALLVLRYAMKVRRWNLRARRNYFAEFQDEYGWLAARTDDDEVAAVAERLAGEAVAERVAALLQAGPTTGGLASLGSLVREGLRPHCSYGRLSREPRALLRKGYRAIGKLNRTVLHAPRPFRRYYPTGGTSVALVGIDGSGKSTHARELETWLGRTVDVHPVYFGSGDGRSSILRAPLKYLNEFRKRLSRKGGDGGTGTALHDGGRDAAESGDRRSAGGWPGHAERRDPDGIDGRVGLARAVWAILLAREKRAKRRRARRARDRGMIVILDRYPQRSVAGHSDGPLLAPWAESSRGSLRRIAAWERAIYADLHERSPDVVVKLRTSPDVAAERKPETPRSDLERKAETVENLEFPNSTVVVIDAERDKDEVQHRLREVVWSAL